MNNRFLLALFFILATTFLLVACEEADGEAQKTEEKETVETSVNAETVPLDKEEEEAKTEEDTESVETDKQEEKQTEKALSELKIHYIDAGQADATLFQYADQDDSYTILYDTGDWNKNDVVNYLSTEDISFIDLIIISHPHADHDGQLAEIVNTYDVGEIWLSGNENSSQTFQRGIEAVLNSDADYHEPRAGEEFDIGPLGIEVLHPSKLTSKLNEDSLSIRFTYGDQAFLFTGDAYKNEELQMIQQTDSIQADILQLGHHGSKTSSDPAFIQAVQPSIAIYSAGSSNSYGHPSAEVVSLIQDSKITLYGTDVHGTIIATTDGKEINIQTKEDGTISPKSTGSSSSPSEKKESETKTESESTSDCVDINEASVGDVQKIIHIGPERAEELINGRPYSSVESLTSIKGIGPARIADIKSQGLACVGG